MSPSEHTDERRQLYAQAAASWPGVVLSEASFQERLSQLENDTGKRAEELAVRDIYLACACLHGVAAAHKHLLALCERVAATIYRASPAPKVEELRQELAALVTAKGESGAVRLSKYTGKSSLYSWLRTCAIRLLPGVSPQEPSEILDEGALEQLVVEALGPASSSERAGVVALAKRSLDQALGTISERGRVVLRQKLALNWSVDQIGAEHGVHRATAARWVESAKDELRNVLLDVLREELGQSSAVFDSICAQISDSLFSTLARHLRQEV